MSKYKSRGGVSIEAHVVDDTEKRLTASMGNGAVEHLAEGDALVTLAGKQYVLRAPLWSALFGDEETATAADKGGQQTSKTK